MVEFSSKIKKFKSQGEKTGWSYIEIRQPAIKALKGDYKRSFRVKGTLDDFPIKNVALIPIGNGVFIMAVKATIRKAIKKIAGDEVRVRIEEDTDGLVLNKDFAECLEDDKSAKEYFTQLPYGHKNYFNNWINAAKTAPTIAKRIAMTLTALSKKQDFGQMIRSNKESRVLY